MKRETALTILETLLDGADPVTGEVLPEGHVCLEPNVMRALHTAVVALQMPETENDAQTSAYPLTKRGRLNAGRVWTEADNQKLIQLYLDGKSMEDICRLLQRRARGVNNQLRYLGFDVKEVMQPDASNIENQHGKPWTRADHDWLMEAWADGVPATEMAAHLGRTVRAVRMRLENFGKYDGGMTAEDEPPAWTEAETKELFRMVDEGYTLTEMARQFGRTKKAMQARLFYLGLSKEAPKLF